MLGVGDPVPPIEGRDGEGTRISLAAYRGRLVVLYFYPRAGSPGCTRETQGFAEASGELERHGVAVIGVSTDPPSRQRAFAHDCGATFPLLSDTDRSIARAFGVLGILGLARRVTFLIGRDGRVLEVVEGMRPGPHLRAAVARFAPGGSGEPDQDSSTSK